jgi:hypothetical protein
MNEDDTYRMLRRKSYDEIVRLIQSLPVTNDWANKIDETIIEGGWTIEQFDMETFRRDERG